MRTSSLALTFAVVATATVFTSVHAAAPAGGPPAGTAPAAGRGAGAGAGGGFGGGGAVGGGFGGGRGAVVTPVAPGTPGYPDSTAVDPAVARKAKWPAYSPTFAVPEGYSGRPQGGNGFYKKDANGNNLPGTDLYTWAPNGHFTNYDYDDVPPYTLPDPLVMQDGRKVTSAEMWFKERRPEIVSLFKDNIYGRVPEEKLPKLIWEVRSNQKSADGKTISKTIVGYFEGTTPDAPAGGRGGAPGPGGPGAMGPIDALDAGALYPTAAPAPAAPGAGGAPGTAPAAGGRGGRGGGGGFGGGFGGGGGGNTISISLTLPVTGKPVPLFFGGPVNDPAGHGWGTGTISGNAGLTARIAPPAGQEKPGNYPGAYAITGWTYSRAIDYLVTDPDVDAKHITIAGMSTGGKQVLFTAAMDERIWCVVPESSGAMGVKLSRRDIGETVDNLATGNFAGNYCPNFAKYVGKWNDLPVDQHEMIALMAPRKMFITGGNQEDWQDFNGGFLAAVAAEPVYTLLGKKGVGTVQVPPVEKPILFGEIGFYHHNGAHTFTGNERQWITMWMEKFLGSMPAAK